jgi:hypothetical protein
MKGSKNAMANIEWISMETKLSQCLNLKRGKKGYGDADGRISVPLESIA